MMTFLLNKTLSLCDSIKESYNDRKKEIAKNFIDNIELPESLCTMWNKLLIQEKNAFFTCAVDCIEKMTEKFFQQDNKLYNAAFNLIINNDIDDPSKVCKKFVRFTLYKIIKSSFNKKISIISTFLKGFCASFFTLYKDGKYLIADKKVMIKNKSKIKFIKFAFKYSLLYASSLVIKSNIPDLLSAFAEDIIKEKTTNIQDSFLNRTYKNVMLSESVGNVIQKTAQITFSSFFKEIVNYSKQRVGITTAKIVNEINMMEDKTASFKTISHFSPFGIARSSDVNIEGSVHVI